MSMASRAILSTLFEEQRTQNHPQYLSGLSRAIFPTTFLEIAVSKAKTLNVQHNFWQFPSASLHSSHLGNPDSEIQKLLLGIPILGFEIRNTANDGNPEAKS